MLFEKLSPAQEKIVKDICFLQLDSLRRIYSDESHTENDIIMLLIENDISKEDWDNQLSVRMERVKATGRLPIKIDSMDKFELSIFKHLLSRVENQYKDTYPQAISNLWQRLFILSDFSEQKFENLN